MRAAGPHQGSVYLPELPDAQRFVSIELRDGEVSAQGSLMNISGNSLGVEEFPEEPGTKKPPWWRRLFAGGTSGT